MSSNEEGKVREHEKTSQAPHPPPEQGNNVHVYHHDWAAMQAYYGPRVAIPQYYNSNVANPHHAPPPPYMWPPPSPMMTPYGTPYPPFCPPAGVYAHPSLPMNSQSQETPGVTTPLNTDHARANSPRNTDHGFMKKLKEFDGLAMSISKASGEHSSETKSSNDASSNASDDNTTGGEQSKRRRRSQEGSPNTDGKPSSQTSSHLRCENEKPAATIMAPILPGAMDFQNSAGTNGFPQPFHGAPHENEKEVKREKRKQSNRESARRSRLRKQAETEELSVKVDALVAENMTLRSKLSQLNDESEKLRLENEALLDQLKAAQLQETGRTENLLSRVDKNNSVDTQHQLLNGTDPVAAS